jgi:hyperosmotically inducible protein
MCASIRFIFLVGVLSAPTFPPAAASPAQQSQEARRARAAANLSREVGHVLRMLPFYTVFDDLKYRIDGDHVVLEGSVTRPTLKSSAENVVRELEGVASVANNIKVLPVSNNDDRIRRAVYRAIFNTGPLFRYSLMAVPSIHIIVDRGNVALEGVVDNEGDKNLARLKASGVSGAFRVANNLVIVKPGLAPFRVFCWNRLSCAESLLIREMGRDRRLVVGTLALPHLLHLSHQPVQCLIQDAECPDASVAH